MAIEYYQAIQANKQKTFLLIGVFLVMVLAIGWVFGELLGSGTLGTILALGFAFVWGMISYYKGDALILKISRAKLADRGKYPHLVHTVEGLAIASGLPVPKVYVIHSEALNAFATGRDPEHASVAVTTGLLAKLNRQELEGVLAHEMSHIRNFDIRIMTLVSILVGVVVIMSDFFLRSLWFGGGRRSNGPPWLMIVGLVLIVVSPIIAMVMRSSISREREYLADASGVELTRNPDGLASALAKIGGDKHMLKGASHATAHLFISNPFKKKGMLAFLDKMFSTHPPMEKRVQRLKAMGEIG